MKKILLAFLLVSTTFVFSQNINEELNGYVEVVKVDSLNKTEIYNKLKEWISINYKSAKDVIQLDTENKIIIKGNFDFSYTQGKTFLTMIVPHILIFSIKDGKYKIGLTPTDMYNPDYPATKKSPYFDMIIESYISNKSYSNKEEYKKLTAEVAKQTYNKLGMSEKEIKKTESYMTEKLLDESYYAFLESHRNFNAEILGIYASIKESILVTEDW